jgi:hypothetical protein
VNLEELVGWNPSHVGGGGGKVGICAEMDTTSPTTKQGVLRRSRVVSAMKLTGLKVLHVLERRKGGAGQWQVVLECDVSVFSVMG